MPGLILISARFRSVPNTQKGKCLNSGGGVQNCDLECVIILTFLCVSLQRAPSDDKSNLFVAFLPDLKENGVRSGF